MSEQTLQAMQLKEIQQAVRLGPSSWAGERP